MSYDQSTVIKMSVRWVLRQVGYAGILALQESDKSRHSFMFKAISMEHSWTELSFFMVKVTPMETALNWCQLFSKNVAIHHNLSQLDSICAHWAQFVDSPRLTLTEQCSYALNPNQPSTIAPKSTQHNCLTHSGMLSHNQIQPCSLPLV